MAWQTYKLLGFCPDLPVTTPGVIVSSDGCISTDRGIGDSPGVSDISSTAVNSQSLGGALLFKTDATKELIVGTATKLYGFDLTTTLTDRSGATYNATTTNTWSVTNFGNIALAANLGDQLQQRTIGAAANFASVGAAPVPKASIVITCGPVSAPFVMVFDYADGVNTDRDGWKCSAISDYTGWTAGTNSCATGRLLDNAAGPITAAIPFRDGVIAWKRTSMYVGEYTGPPNIWSWRRVSSDVGCVGKNACCEANDIIYFADDSGIWMFDGSYPKPVPGYIHKYWTEAMASLGSNSTAFIRLIWDKLKHLLFVNFSASNLYTNTGSLIFNTVSGLWTQGTSFVNAANAIAPGEIICARYFVSLVSKKIGTFTYGSTTPDHKAANFFAWVFTDQVNDTIIKGVRPHWSGNYGPSTSTASWLSGAIYTFAAERDIQPGAVNNIVATFPLSPRIPGKLDGIGSGAVVLVQVTVAASTSFEITGISMDIGKTGKS